MLFRSDPISSKYKSMIVDSDEAKKLIPEFDDGFGAGYVHEESKRIVADVTEFVTDEGRNVVIPIVGSNYAKLKKRYIDDLRQKGYKVYIHMADINPMPRRQSAGSPSRRCISLHALASACLPMAERCERPSVCVSSAARL